MTYRVMIVDDSRLARMSLGRTLGNLYPDWTRIEAANAEEAIALLAREGADIAFLDFNMPGRDGLELAGELQALRPGMPVAVISANTQREVVAQATQLNATFLAKPVTQEALQEFLAAARSRLEAA